MIIVIVIMIPTLPKSPRALLSLVALVLATTTSTGAFASPRFPSLLSGEGVTSTLYPPPPSPPPAPVRSIFERPPVRGVYWYYLLLSNLGLVDYKFVDAGAELAGNDSTSAQVHVCRCDLCAHNDGV